MVRNFHKCKCSKRCDLVKNHELIVVLMRNQNAQTIIQPNILYYMKYDELFSKIYYKCRLNFNLPSNLNKNFSVELYICEHLHHVIAYVFVVPHLPTCPVLRPVCPIFRPNPGRKMGRRS